MSAKPAKPLRQARSRSETLEDMLTPAAIQLLSTSGVQMVKAVGLDVIRGIVLDVLCGKNVRDSTEMLTRRRLAALNLAMLDMFIRGKSRSSDFVHSVLDKAVKVLETPKIKKQERWLAMWLLGLTGKASQNVLRNDPLAISTYKDLYVHTCESAIQDAKQQYGAFRGQLELSNGVRAEIDWAFMMYLLNTVGAQTLAIRGSDKSKHGKLFEKLILGSVLQILGFELLPPGHEPSKSRVFCLSSRKERRESDATLFFEKGKAIRFDIGFIGRGNPEISSDKLTRFEKQVTVRDAKWYVATFIIVDQVGPGSKIDKLAKDVDATLIQMSMAYWPQQLARELKRALGYKHELATMKESQIRPYLAQVMLTVPIDKLAGFVSDTENDAE